MSTPTVLLSGTSNPSLAAAVASALNTSLGAIEITRFIDNECRVYITEEIKGKDVFILQSLSAVADQHLVELCLIGQAAKSLGSQRVTAVIPWMGYSKQDKAFRRGEAVSAQLVAKVIEVAGFDAVMTCELHSENVVPFFRMPVTELSTHELFRSSLEGSHPSRLETVDDFGKGFSPDFAIDDGKRRGDAGIKKGFGRHVTHGDYKGFTPLSGVKPF
ncbi:ribose-phosphate pyrophosphokinase [Candidatus Gottesmanbacteria bacterium]|nr:ribose-phosphate pyrophosphokinase [Candidatus Gottesmanbacteria bacterium]